MSGPVQVIPAGLLGFFQLKSLGRNPADLAEAYQPIVEMRDWLFVTQSVDFGPGPLAAVTVLGGVQGGQRFTANPIQTPSNEWWYVHNYTIRSAALVAGDTSNIAPLLFTPITGVINTYLLTSNAGVALTGPNRTQGVSAQGFWMPPLSELGFLIYENTSAAGIAYTGTARITRLPI